VQQVSEAVAGQVTFVRVNTDTFPQIAEQWDVQAIPALVRVEAGQEVARLIGFRPAEQILAWVSAPKSRSVDP